MQRSSEIAADRHDGFDDESFHHNDGFDGSS
jgi:hypothetical protein